MPELPDIAVYIDSLQAKLRGATLQRLRVLLVVVGLDRAGELNSAAEEQELLGERGLAGVGVGDDRKGAAAGNLF